MRHPLLSFAAALLVLVGIGLTWHALFAPATAQDLAPGERSDLAPGKRSDLAPGKRSDLAPGKRSDLAPGEHTGGKVSKNAVKNAAAAETRRLVKLAKQKPSDDPFGQPSGADAPRGDAPAANADPADPFAPRDLKPFVNEDAFTPQRKVKPPVVKIDLNDKVEDDSTASEQQIDAALLKRGDFEFKELPLDRVVEQLAKRYDIEIQLDDKALADAAVASDTPITFKAKNISLRSALRLMLRPLQLTYMLRDEVLSITAQAEADQRLIVRGYPVADLLLPWAKSEFGEAPLRDEDALTELVRDVILPTSWDTSGGMGSAKVFRDTLTVSQTMEQHKEIESLLATARQVQRAQRKTLGGKPVWANPDLLNKEADETFQSVLKSRTEVRFSETSLKDAIASMAEKAGLNILIDQKALADAAVAEDTPLTLHSQKISLEATLQLLLRPLQLACIVRDEVLLVTTQSQADQTLLVRLYPIGDLALSIDEDHQTSIATAEKLRDLCIATVRPLSWDEVGASGTILFHEPSMSFACFQTREVHDEIERLFTQLRQDLPKAPAPGSAGVKREARFVLKVYYLPGPEVAKPYGGFRRSTIPVVGEHAPASVSRDVLAQIDPAAKPPVLNNSLPKKPENPTPEPKSLTLTDAQLLIKDLVEPESWQHQQAYLRVATDRLVVRQTEGVHRKIKNLLGELEVAGYKNPHTGIVNEPRKPVAEQAGGFGGAGTQFGGGAF